MKMPGVWGWPLRADDKANWPSTRPRLWRWQERAKPLAMATLASAFLLQLLGPLYEPLRLWLLRPFWHRTGWHLRARQGSVVPPALCTQPLVATLSALLCCLGKATARCLRGSHHLGHRSSSDLAWAKQPHRGRTCSLRLTGFVTQPRGLLALRCPHQDLRLTIRSLSCSSPRSLWPKCFSFCLFPFS
jgi:hypothetical protein